MARCRSRRAIRTLAPETGRGARRRSSITGCRSRTWTATTPTTSPRCFGARGRHEPDDMTVFHVSEEADIALFEPRAVAGTGDSFVWAIDGARLCNYLV